MYSDMEKNNYIGKTLKDLDALFCKKMYDKFCWADKLGIVNLKGYKRKAEKSGFIYSCMSRRLHRLVIDELDMYIPYHNENNNNYTSREMYPNSENISENVVKDLVKNWIESWITCEKDTEKYLQEVWYSCIDYEIIPLANEVKKWLDATICKLKKLNRKLKNLEACNFSMVVILQEQNCIHDEVRDRLGDIFKDIIG